MSSDLPPSSAQTFKLPQVLRGDHQNVPSLKGFLFLAPHGGWIFLIGHLREGSEEAPVLFGNVSSHFSEEKGASPGGFYRKVEKWCPPPGVARRFRVKVLKLLPGERKDHLAHPATRKTPDESLWVPLFYWIFFFQESYLTLSFSEDPPFKKRGLPSI